MIPTSVKLTVNTCCFNSIPHQLDTQTSFLSHNLSSFISVGSRLHYTITCIPSNFKLPYTSQQFQHCQNCLWGSIKIEKSYILLTYNGTEKTFPFQKGKQGITRNNQIKTSPKSIRTAPLLQLCHCSGYKLSRRWTPLHVWIPRKPCLTQDRT